MSAGRSGFLLYGTTVVLASLQTWITSRNGLWHVSDKRLDHPCKLMALAKCQVQADGMTGQASLSFSFCVSSFTASSRGCSSASLYTLYNTCSKATRESVNSRSNSQSSVYPRFQPTACMQSTAHIDVQLR